MSKSTLNMNEDAKTTIALSPYDIANWETNNAFNIHPTEIVDVEPATLIACSMAKHGMY